MLFLIIRDGNLLIGQALQFMTLLEFSKLAPCRSTPNGRHSHADDIVLGEEEFRSYCRRSESEVAKRSIDSGRVFLADADPDVEVVVARI
jgi:hypothetical protein